MNGFVFIDKQKGMTSFDVVRDVRRATGVKRVGHAGTLDPLATGLLIVAIGEGTKLLEYLLGQDKEYLVTACFGAISDTYDAEGEIRQVSNAMMGRDNVEKAMKAFRGEILQVPPKYSALKIGGKRACDLVREGKEVEMKGRQVQIEKFEIESFNWPKIDFVVQCGSGTYIRSLIHDLGQVLGCGAYVEELRRTKIGTFDLYKAVKPAELSNNVDQSLVTLEEVAREFSSVELSSLEMEKLKDGRTLESKNIEQGSVEMAFYNEKLVGILENSPLGGVKFRRLIV